MHAPTSPTTLRQARALRARRDEPGLGDDYLLWMEPEDSERAERRRRSRARQSVGFEPQFRDGY
ncbi:MAG: hypothetical protein HYV16_04020 [Gammaproteobacteria bacterium]|nr:hypothetical protein [Gammaproteobacteria bacterium]